MATQHGNRAMLKTVSCISNVSLPGTDVGSLWDIRIEDSKIQRVEGASDIPSNSSRMVQGGGGLLVPSMCHPHIHLDKAFLISHPRYSHLQPEKGDFQEAMDLTGQAKAQFQRKDLLERGQRVIDESVSAGVTHIRAFVEVDAGVGTKCLDAGVELKQRASSEGTCFVQLCAFAQLPLFSSSKKDPEGETIRGLMRDAARKRDVSAIGSTPYVETERSKMEKNVEWMIDLSIEFNLHLDFHLDYHLDPNLQPLVWYVVRMLREKSWKDRTTNKTIVLGHCTSLTLFKAEDWWNLATEIKANGLPISFVGLPTSDLFMMRTGKQPEVRGTLDVPKLIKEYGLNACIGVNNIGNAFTPQGTCDPLSLACQGVGVYQAGTKRDTELLFECVSTRAMAAIGMGRHDGDDVSLDIRPEDPADVLLFSGSSDRNDWQARKTVSEAVYLYDSCQGRRLIASGKIETR